ncbi:amphi-Trp domain-containing protein [Haloplanus halophilus]|uniref:amphi-Trp domain-containing protein n=1 Tax=Haloplanus halophilus TaxID=2949993 RepID=UPI002040A896|nr:amphi-Trp domain-containing protein [Haloplanus sp. GDY1]
MPDLPDDDPTSTVADDYFEQTYAVSASEAGAFLIDLGELLRAGEDVTLDGDDWELPFAYREPVELEIEYVGGSEPELEIELELTSVAGDEDPPSLG